MLLHATSKTNMEILDTVIKQIKEIIHVYNSIKENQIKDIETYANM